MEGPGDRAPVPKELAPQPPGHAPHRHLIVDLSRCHAKCHQLPLVVAHQMQLETNIPPQGGLAPRGIPREHLVAADAPVVTDRQGGGVDKGDAGAASFAGGQIPAQGHHRPGQQFHKAARADQGWEVRAQVSLHICGVVMFEVAVMAGVEEHDDGHDLAEGQVPLADAVPLALLEQALHIQWCKPLAKIITIADHGDKLAHRDLRMVQAAFRDTATRRWSLWAGKTLRLIPNSGYLRERGFPVFTTRLHQYIAFREAIGRGLTVREYEPAGKAARDLAQVYDELQEYCDGNQKA